MAFLLRAHLTAGVAIVVASAVVAASSPVPPPVSRPVTSHTIELTAAVGPLWPTPKPDNIPTLADEIQRGIVPSLGAPVPTPNIPAPAPAATNINQAIKNIYNAVEPWVRYGFELATYAVGWVPWVGWLSPQIMIFYNFGERIVRSITFNLDDWLFGPLPFLQGVGNVARDSWNALVQLGVDQWDFWLPPLPPLPFTAQQTTMLAPNVTTAQQPGQRPGLPTLPTTNPARALVAAAHRLVAHAAQARGNVATGIASQPDVNPTDAPVLEAVVATPAKAAADLGADSVGKGPATVATTVRASAGKAIIRVAQHGGNDAEAHKSAQERRQKKSEPNN